MRKSNQLFETYHRISNTDIQIADWLNAESSDQKQLRLKQTHWYLINSIELFTLPFNKVLSIMTNTIKDIKTFET